MAFSYQCLLRRRNVSMVTWVPEKFAKKGKYLKLQTQRQSNGLSECMEWQNGWQVMEVYGKKDSKQVHEEAHKHNKFGASLVGKERITGRAS